MTPDRAAKLHAVIDRQSGELFTIIPMAPPDGDVNARASNDPDRNPLDFTGVWVAPQVEMARRPHVRPEGHRRDISAARPQVKFAADQLPYAAAIGDRVTRVATLESYEVAQAGGDGFGRIVLSLTARGGLLL